MSRLRLGITGFRSFTSPLVLLETDGQEKSLELSLAPSKGTSQQRHATVTKLIMGGSGAGWWERVTLGGAWGGRSLGTTPQLDLLLACGGWLICGLVSFSCNV